MTKKIAEKIVKGITDKIECNTADIDDWAEFWGFTRDEYEEFLDMAIKAQQESQTFEWCTDCKEYDQEKHCCHRWSKVIRNTVEEMKQEPCENAISREDLINRMKSVRSHYYKNGKIDGYKNLPTEMKIRIDEVDYLIGQIEDAPPVQPKPKTGHWTPISERPPEESGTYTVTAYDGATKRVTYVKYLKRLKQWELTGSRAYWKVLAWMPLPEPYESQESKET